ncbi:MAG: hypothetical protein ACXWRA_16755 [Pseudobdellovibrionaceae bacterium]
MRNHLVPGHSYRRSDLAAFTSNVDRHLQTLVSEGSLKKLSPGLYLAPKATVFGESLPDEHSLLRTFLKDDHFVVYSLSQFNSLGLGSTQLYNTRVVFNRKRTGERTVGGRTYVFRLWREAPKSLSQEFLVIELLNRLSELAEDRDLLLENLKSKISEFNLIKLSRDVKRFGTLSAQKRFKELLRTTVKVNTTLAAPNTRRIVP